MEFLNTFDLNICRLAITQVNKNENDTCKRINFYHQINNYLNESELLLIQQRKMYMFSLTNRCNSAERILKYISRRFTLVNPKTYEVIDLNKYLQLVGKNYPYCDKGMAVYKYVEICQETDAIDDNYDDFLIMRYRKDINKTVFKELVEKVLKPERLKKIADKYDVQLFDLLDSYHSN